MSYNAKRRNWFLDDLVECLPAHGSSALGIANGWIGRRQQRGRRVLMISFDEGRPEHDRRAWWSPGNGNDGQFQRQRQVAGGRQSFTAPGGGDWALRIRRK